jgi:hypothetical protein
MRVTTPKSPKISTNKPNSTLSPQKRSPSQINRSLNKSTKSLTPPKKSPTK